MHSFKQVIEKLEAAEYDGKIVSAQAFFKLEDEALKSGEIDVSAGVETVEFVLSETDRAEFAKAAAEETYEWIDRADAADEHDDMFLTRDGLVRYLKQAAHDKGQVFKAEINAKLRSFIECDDVSDKVKKYEPVALPSLPEQEGAEQGPFTLAEFFNDVSRRDKIVAFAEFNRIAKENETKSFAPIGKYNLKGQLAQCSPKEAIQKFEENLIVALRINANLDEAAQYFVSTQALQQYVSGMDLDERQAEMIARCFDECADYAPMIKDPGQAWLDQSGYMRVDNPRQKRFKP